MLHILNPVVQVNKILCSLVDYFKPKRFSVQHLTGDKFHLCFKQANNNAERTLGVPTENTAWSSETNELHTIPATSTSQWENYLSTTTYSTTQIGLVTYPWNSFDKWISHWSTNKCQEATSALNVNCKNFVVSASISAPFRGDPSTFYRGSPDNESRYILSHPKSIPDLKWLASDHTHELSWNCLLKNATVPFYGL